MPIYEYRCENGHTFEVLQAIADDPVETCEQCGAPVQRVMHPVAVHFKGSGFYSTDYAGKGKSKDDGSKDGTSGESGGDSKSEEKKSASKPDSSSNGSSGEEKTKAGSGSD
jgi:putative FmdB family regulatory protein